MEEWFLEPVNVLVCILIFVMLLLAIWIAVMGSRLKKLRAKYVEVMGNTGVSNLEDVIAELRQQLQVQKEKSELMHNQIAVIQEQLPEMKSKVGVLRYNAFSDGGSDLSFSIAVVNDKKDGVVFSGLHSRESTYVYAKPVENGASAYPLTPEEQQALAKAK